MTGLRSGVKGDAWLSMFDAWLDPVNPSPVGPRKTSPWRGLRMATSSSTRHGMYLPTVAWFKSITELERSPWMRGAALPTI